LESLSSLTVVRVSSRVTPFLYAVVLGSFC
jgi:hypothetical protein